MGIGVGQAVPAALAEATVLDAAGEARRLGTCWSERDAVLVFVRHFACAGCSAHVGELRPRLGELAALGVAVALIGNGTPAQLAAFVEREALVGHPIALYTDPTRTAYREAGLERSWLGTVGPRAVASLVALAARGHANGRPKGDLLQQGGTLYVTREGVVAFEHRSRRLGDHARVVDVVEVALARRATDALAAGLA